MLDFQKRVKKDSQPYRCLFPPSWLWPYKSPSFGTNSPEGPGRRWAFFWATKPKFVGFWTALLHHPFPGGCEEGHWAPSGPLLGAKCFQSFALLFLPPGMTVTRSDLCPVPNFKPISLPPPPQPWFGYPAHPVPHAKICISHFFHPSLSFSSPKPALWAVGFLAPPRLSPCWWVTHRRLRPVPRTGLAGTGRVDGRAAVPNLARCQPEPSHSPGKGDSWGREVGGRRWDLRDPGVPSERGTGTFG